ncbi:hypothetical protein ACFE04_019161 [Oxalis oulophora]
MSNCVEMILFGLPWPDLNDGIYYNDVVKPSDSELLTLIDYYTKKHKSSAPYEGWLQRIHNGQITLDRTVVNDPNTIIRPGSELVYHRLPWKEPEAPYSLQLLYEDDDLIALNKPSGLQVLPGGLFQQRTVLTQLQWRNGKHISSPGIQEPHPVPVHRLGRGTSGLLLCAKTKLAKTRLAAYFADGTSIVQANSNQSNEHGMRRKITKIYRALSSGVIHEDKVEIQSGRPHQIRIHLSFIGHPLLGDPLYVSGGIPKSEDCELVDESFAHDGGYERPNKPVPGDCGYYLHAHQVVLSQPTTNEEIKITAPLPIILQSVKDTLDLKC